MTPPTQAVFLSYASQDAEAVARIAEALRASGVEVWFDKDELVGGDAWDAKIRKQIAECALFVPIISANTQARLEGYFRIEWKLAAQRTHAMAEEKAFLLPVVIDDTRDAEAKVPGEFKAVQWTRLAGGEGAAVERFCARVGKLLGGSAVLQPAREESAPGLKHRATPEVGRRVPAAAWGVAAAVMAVALGVGGYFWSKRTSEAGPHAGAGTRPLAAEKSIPVSEANRLVAKAWEQMDKTEMARNELLLAEDFCRQAAALEETNPAVWAAWSAMNTWYYFHQFERSPARKEAARDYAQKALAIDPKSYEARYAWAHFIVRMAAEGKIGDERPALPILRELLRERPDEARALYALGFGLICDPANADEGFATLERLAEKHPWFAGRALNELGWIALFYGRLGLSESAAERALKSHPYWNNLGLKATLALRLHGDVELAQATIDRLPPTALQENWGISLAVMVAAWRGDHSRAVSILQGVPRDWLENFFYYGPTSFLSGQMRLKAKQVTAAEKDFRRALELIAPRLDKTPNDPALLYYKAEAQRLLGMRDEAEKTYRQLREVWPDTFAPLTFEPPQQALDYVRRMVVRGHGIEYVFPSGWNFTVASLRLDPMFENVRRAPGFGALAEEAEQREKKARSLNSAAAGAKTQAVVLEKVNVPDKSVAVLAFKNLSGDPAREFFSDGLSEAVTDVLGRVPGLKVVGSASAFSFKGKAVSIPEIARQLGVTHLVEGTVLQEGQTVRITAKLINADGFQVWGSDKLDRELKNIFALHDEVAGLIAKSLSLQLGAGSAVARAEVNPQALELFVRGREAWKLRTLADYERAENLLNRALALEPSFARAHAALADVWVARAQDMGVIGGIGQRNSPEHRRIVEKINQALALDPDLAEAHASLGGVAWVTWQSVEGERELRRAIALNPNYATARQWLGRLLLNDGRMDEALAELKRATEIEPLAPRILDNYGIGLALAGRYREALVAYDRALALQPNSVQPLRGKASALAASGLLAEAVALVQTIPLDSVGRVARAVLLTQAGRKAEAEALLTGFEPEDRGLLIASLLALGLDEEALTQLTPAVLLAPAAGSYLFDAFYDPVRNDSRWVKVMAEVGLTEAHARAQAWRKAHPPEKVEAKP